MGKRRTEPGEMVVVSGKVEPITRQIVETLAEHDGVTVSRFVRGVLERVVRDRITGAATAP